MFLKSKEKTFSIFKAFAKQVQVKYNERIAGIRSDHIMKFEKAKFNKFFNKLGVD